MCTRCTSSKSTSDMLTIVVSRRMPALFTRMSRSPNVSTASATTARAPSQLAMSCSLPMALPPNARISSATSALGVGSLPLPSLATPRSFTTTATPRAARNSACSRPSPRPAPVTTATRPSRSTMTRRKLQGRLQRGELHRGAAAVGLSDLRWLTVDRDTLDRTLGVAEREHRIESGRREDRRRLLIRRRRRDVGEHHDVGSARHHDLHVAPPFDLGAFRHALADDRAEREVVAEHLIALT